MTSQIGRRLQALETERIHGDPASYDHSSLAAVLDRAGLSEQEAIERHGSLPAFAHAWVTAAPTSEQVYVDGLSAQERYLRMLDPEGRRRGKAA